MRKIIFLMAVLFFLGNLGFGYCLEWKRLHEVADTLSLPEAVSRMEGNADSLDDLYVTALVYLEVHKIKEADEIFVRMLKLEPLAYEANWGRAEVLRRQHEMEKSQEILVELIKAHPGFAPAYITLSYIKYFLMEFSQSIALAQKVINMGQENVDLSNYTRAYLLLGGNKGMLAYYGGPFSKVANGLSVLPNLKRAQKLQPNSQAVLFGLGSFYFLAPAIAGGNIDKAEKYLKQAVQVDPLFADAYVRLAQIYRMRKQVDKYTQYLNKALEIDPQNELAADFKNKKCKFVCLTVNED